MLFRLVYTSCGELLYPLILHTTEIKLLCICNWSNIYCILFLKIKVKLVNHVCFSPLYSYSVANSLQKLSDQTPGVGMPFFGVTMFYLRMSEMGTLHQYENYSVYDTFH